MLITLIQKPNITIAHVVSDQIIFHNAEDAAELLMNCLYQGADAMLVDETNLPPAFFDLKTKLAGDILQKFSTYNGRLAIVGDFTKYDSKSLKDFIYESNKQRRVVFAQNMEEAEDMLQ